MFSPNKKNIFTDGLLAPIGLPVAFFMEAMNWVKNAVTARKRYRSFGDYFDRHFTGWALHVLAGGAGLAGAGYATMQLTTLTIAQLGLTATASKIAAGAIMAPFGLIGGGILGTVAGTAALAVGVTGLVAAGSLACGLLAGSVCMAGSMLSFDFGQFPKGTIPEKWKPKKQRNEITPEQGMRPTAISLTISPKGAENTQVFSAAATRSPLPPKSTGARTQILTGPGV